MNTGKRRKVRIVLILLAAGAAWMILKEAIVPAILRRALISAVHDGCKTCELSLGRVRVSLLPPALSARDLRFSGGTPNATVVQAEAKRVYAPLSLLPLFKDRFRLGRIEIEQPAVTVTEGDLYGPASAEGGGGKRSDLEIAGIQIKHGSFVYIREYPGRKGIIGVSEINASAGPIGTSDRLRDAKAAGTAAGLLEGSGKFRLEAGAMLFAKVPDIDVKLDIAGQELAGLNRFFKPSDGIQLKGSILEARSAVVIRGARLSSSAYVRYTGLDVKIKKYKERGALSAFFQNLLASVTMGKQNAAGGNYDRTGTAELERKPKETLISFALRGMKEAAMKIPSQGHK